MAIERRDFVKLGVASGVATAITSSCTKTFAAEGDGLPIIDTHQHLWDLVQFQPPWLNGADAKIAAKHDMSNYLTETAGLNELPLSPLSAVERRRTLLLRSGLLRSHT